MKKIIVRDREMELENGQMLELKEGKIRVKVAFCGVGFADVMAVKGKYALAPKRPFSPGYEFSGIVEASGNSDFPLGTRVVAMLPLMQCYQEYLDIDPVYLIKVPENVSLEQASVIPLNYLTALALIEKSAGLGKGDTLLVHGAAGGVGTAVLEMGKVLGLKTYGTASAGKHELVKRLSGIPFDYKKPDWIKEDFYKLEPEGVNAVFDAMGSESFNRSWRLLKKDGVLCAYGFYKDSNSGTGAMIAGLLNLLFKIISPGKRKVAVCWAPAIIKADQQWYRKSMEKIMNWLTTGKIDPVIYTIVNYEDVQNAHNILIEKKAAGKVLLKF